MGQTGSSRETEARREDKPLSTRREERAEQADGRFCADCGALEMGGCGLAVTLPSRFLTFSSIIVENQSDDMVIELKQAKFFQRAVKESWSGKRPQPMCKGWNPS